MSYNYEDSMDFAATNDLTGDLMNVNEPRWMRKQRQQQQTQQGGVLKTNTSLNIQSSGADRFIPSRQTQDMDMARFHLMNSCGSQGNDMDTEEDSSSQPAVNDENSAYNKQLDSRLLDGKALKESKVLALSEKAPEPSKDWENNLRVIYTHNKFTGGVSGSTLQRKNSISRHISQAPARILDAPGLIDDYYLNLLDWSSNNQLAVALSDSIYLWDAESGNIQKLMSCNQNNQEQPDNFITSLSWTADGNNLAVGTNYNEIQIWDVNRTKNVRTMKGHNARVSSCSWNSFILSTGGKDGKVINHDVRVQQHILSVLSGHADFEVCGLKWSPDGSLLASGGNDNVLNIWGKDTCGSSAPNGQAKFSLREHTAAVKALAWCPWQSNLLASGGGTNDRRIMFWNTSTGNMLNQIDTKSQVCSLQWSRNDREIVSSHGFSQNQLCVWKYPSLVKVTELSGHQSRVLHLAQSPDGSTVVSAAGDETLRFWKVFSTPSDASAMNGIGARGGIKDTGKTSMMGMRSIR